MALNVEQHQAQHQANGEELLKKANEELKKFRLFNKIEKYEIAGKYFHDASNKFELAGDFERAGSIFMEAARTFEKNKQECIHDYIKSLVRAAKCFRKSGDHESQLKAINVYRILSEQYLELNKFRDLAGIHTSLADIYEELNDFEQHVQNLELAIKYFTIEEQYTSANKLCIRLADYLVRHEKFQLAIPIYRNVAQKSIDNNLLKWSATGYYFKATLCHLAVVDNDIQKSQDFLDEIQVEFPMFDNSRECKLCNGIIQVFSTHDENKMENFETLIVQYDSISRLDPLITNILLHVKTKLKNHVYTQEEIKTSDETTEMISYA